MGWTGIFQELAEARDSDTQLSQYAAVAAGLRRALDDWVPVDRVASYCALTTRLGLSVEVDCVFESVANGAQITGSDFAPTTRASASLYRKGIATSPDSRLHVVVSSRSEWAADALAAAWYPVAVESRVLRKPLIDHARMGRALGYPSCCVEFFVSHNDWSRQNTLAEAARRSGSFHWEANCLTKFTPWMLSFHMPCAFDCKETIRYAHEVLELVRTWDPKFADQIVAYMRRPCFALSERFACALDGVRPIARNHDAYEAVEDLCRGIPIRTRDDEARVQALNSGDACRIDGGTVYIYNDGMLHAMFDAKADLSIVEVPLLLPFE